MVRLTNRFVWIVLLTLGFGAIGWVDDWRKVVNKDPEGMRSARSSSGNRSSRLLAALYLVFSVSGTTCACWGCSCAGCKSRLLHLTAQGRADRAVLQTVSYPLGVFGFIALTCYFVIVGSSNAVNLTDGLDGGHHAGGLVGSALGVFAYVTGNAVFARYLLFPHIRARRAADLLLGDGWRGLAFPLVQHASGAQVFMGDVGALALGGALGHHRRDRAPGDRAGHHGRHLRRWRCR